MQVVCEATQANDADVQTAAFECLVKIMQYFYDLMQYYMERALFGVSHQQKPPESPRVFTPHCTDALMCPVCSS